MFTKNNGQGLIIQIPVYMKNSKAQLLQLENIYCDCTIHNIFPETTGIDRYFFNYSLSGLSII